MSKIQYKHLDLAGASLVQRRHKRQTVPPGMWAVDNFISGRSDNALTLRPDFKQENTNIFGISSGLQLQNFDETKDILNSVHGIFGSDSLVWFTSYVPWGVYETSGFEQILSSTMTTGRAMAADDSYTVLFNSLGAYDIRKKWWRGCILEFNGDGNYYLINDILSGHASNGTGNVSLTMPAQSDYANNVNYLGGTYKFTASGGGTNEYYCELLAGGDPSLTDPFYVYLDGSAATEGTVGSLNDHEWGWGDGDTLGYNTLYLRDDTGDPDVSGITLTGDTGHTYEVYRTHNSFRADNNKMEIDEFGGAIIYCTPTISDSFSALDICGPFYSNVTESDWEYRASGFINSEVDYYDSTDYLDSAYQWTKSDRYAYAYYLEASGGGDPGISSNEASGVLKIDGDLTQKSWQGVSYFSGWEYGDRDGLGFNTIYISAYNQGYPGAPADVFSTIVGYFNDVAVAYQKLNYSLATTGTSWILLNTLSESDGGFWRTLDISKNDAWDWIPLRGYCTINVPQPNGDDVLNQVSDNPLVFTSIRRNSYLGFLASGYVKLSSTVGGGTTRYPCVAYSTDQGFEWTVKIDADSDGAASTSLGCEFDGTTLFMLSKPSGTDHYFRYSTDGGATWTTCAGITDIDGSLPKVKYIGSTFVVVGNDGSIYHSSDGQTFAEKDVESDLSDFVGDDIAYNESGSGTAYWVVVDDTEQIIGRSTTVSGTYADVTPSGLATMTWHVPELTYVFYDVLGQRFIINCGTFFLVSTDDGATWEQHTNGFENLILRSGYTRPTNFDWSGQLLATMFDQFTTDHTFQYILASRDYEVSWKVDLFVPISDLYRATTFAVLDGYTVLIGTREWNAGTEEWDYHPKRIRWSSPGTYSDFTSTGTGTADAAGPGAFLAAKTANGRIVVFETNRVSAITPRGDTDDPWDFDVIKEDFKILSNPVAVDDTVYFIASDGLLWSSDGINVAELGASFDLTEFDDFDEKKPVWLVFSRRENALYCFYRNKNATEHSAFSISLANGGVTEASLLEIDDSVVKSEKPGSIVSVSGSTVQKLYVSHHPFSDDTDLVSAALLNIDNQITGLDDLGSSKTGYWHAMIESGELYITQEGEKSSVKHLIIETYTANSVNDNFDPPHLAVEVKSIEDGEFTTSGDTVGTATMTTSELTGSGTAWSNLIASESDDDPGDTQQECDGAETDFTLPCLGSQARVYLDSTLQVAGTDYTVSGKTISFDSAPAATKTLYAYWENYPEVKAKVGDFFKSTEGWHRVTAISSAQDITLDHYLSTGSETVTHYPAWQLDDGHGRVETGINRLVEGVQIRLYLIPDYDGTQQSTIAKITGLSIGYVPQGRKIVKATGS